MTSIRELLVNAVERHRCEAILLSGGLDTSVVATLAAPRGLRLAVTVAVGDAPDLPYATEIAARLGLEHVILRRTVAELAATLPALIGVIGSFDGMFLRNDVVVYEGLREVARRGARKCWTGDAADELFAGYSFMFRKPAAEVYREVFGGSPRSDPALPKECPGCHARGPDGTYCTVCGAYPI